MRLYVGNIARTSTDEQLLALMVPFGTPEMAKIAKERSGEPRGFGFVEFGSEAEGRAAIAGLDGKDFNGQILKVNEARPQKPAGAR
ncbi:MAG: RNA recognition motif domain-containing protein [Thermoanaerobaculia bacterium]